MPLKITCEGCGSELFVKAIQPDRKFVFFYYDCPKCNWIDHEEWINKKTW